MALLSRASCDIASKMVTGRSAKTLFMEVIFRKVLGSDQPPALVGIPAAFQPNMPPARCLSYGRPAACAASDAVTERLPERQAKTTCLPFGSGIFFGSKLDSGTTTPSG